MSVPRSPSDPLISDRVSWEHIVLVRLPNFLIGLLFGSAADNAALDNGGDDACCSGSEATCSCSSASSSTNSSCWEDIASLRQPARQEELAGGQHEAGTKQEAEE